MLTISTSHNIALTREQRYTLASGNAVEVMGISVPVWFFKGNTSEPASEVFCKYVLTNVDEDYPITTLASGYKINLPQLAPGIPLITRPKLEEQQTMTIGELEEWSRENLIPPNGNDLKDPADGGVSSIRFKKYAKIEADGRKMKAIHNIEIISEENLIRSLSGIVLER